MVKKALITGIAGQDGSYLAEFLLARGYEVHGIVRRQSIEDPSIKLINIAGVIDRIVLHVASLENHLSLYKVISEVQPNECYHLAASSFVSYSFDDESSLLAINFNGTHHLLASIKDVAPECRFFFAGSSEMFGLAKNSPQNEATPFNPRSIYGIFQTCQPSFSTELLSPIQHLCLHWHFVQSRISPTGLQICDP